MQGDEHGRQAPTTPSWQPGRGRLTVAAQTSGHTSAALFCFVVLAVLLTGLVAGMLGSGEDKSVIRQALLRPRGATASATTTPPTALPPPDEALASAPPSLPAAVAPVGATPTVGAVGARPSPNGAAGPGTRIAAAGREHVIERGDTLFALALRYDTTVDAIMAANSITDRTEPLSVGRRLTIPAG